MAQLSDDTMRELTQYLEVQGIEWARQFIAGRASWLAKKNIRATGELISSLQSEVISTLEGAARTRLEIAFNEYGRYVEMKGIRPPAGGSDYIAAIEAWIDQKGLRQKMLESYLRKRKVRRLPENILNQLAWSVAISRHQRYKRRQWYNKPKSASITDLFNRVAANLPDLVAREIKNAFQHQT